jgi:hypothetical protein
MALCPHSAITKGSQPTNESSVISIASGIELDGIAELSLWSLAHLQRFVEYLETTGLLRNDAHTAAGAKAVLRQCCGENLPPGTGDGVENVAHISPCKRLRTSNVSLSCWQSQARAALLKPGLGTTAPQAASDWRKEAIARWGESVPAEPSIANWKEYVVSRLPVLTPLSPFDIMQERYAYDPWRLLVACTLMTRINSEKIKEETIAAFFMRFPSPSVFLGRDSELEKVLQEILRPLGLVESRVKTLIELSQRFLQMPVFDCGHKKGMNKISGCGPFAVDSFLIFCRGYQLADTQDASCMKYLEWRKSNEASLDATFQETERAGLQPQTSQSQGQQMSLATFFKRR